LLGSPPTKSHNRTPIDRKMTSESYVSLDLAAPPGRTHGGGSHHRDSDPLPCNMPRPLSDAFLLWDVAICSHHPTMDNCIDPVSERPRLPLLLSMERCCRSQDLTHLVCSAQLLDMQNDTATHKSVLWWALQAAGTAATPVASAGSQCVLAHMGKAAPTCSPDR
jgi:hypothetical protein